jgi:hypothetical protein
MNPLNNNTEGCSPVSSNCVIWQGRDIECIKLCKGDTITDVVFKLATELCTIMDQTNVDNYTLSCLAPANCPPSDFQGLIQLIIDKLCALTDCCESNSGSPTTTRGCPDDCQLVVAPCFRYTNQFGDLVTSMTLTDYAIAIGNKVCDLVSQITTINATLVSLDIRVTVLENTPPPVYTPPTVTPVCVLPSNPTQMNFVLAALEQEFCALQSATGTPTDIFQVIQYRQCTDPYFSALPNWIPTAGNLAQSLNNLWVAMCNMRADIVNIQTNCCPGGCEGIALSMYTELVGSTLYLFPTGTVPLGFTQCSPGTTSFSISDQSGHTYTGSFNFLANLNGAGYPIDLSLVMPTFNLADNINTTMSPCLQNTTTGSQCSYALSYFLGAQSACATLSFTPAETSITYTGVTTSVVPGNYLVELWDNALTTLLSSTNFPAPVPPIPISGSFIGLSPSTFYKIRIKFTPTSGGLPTYCPYDLIITLSETCPEPENLVVTIIP